MLKNILYSLLFLVFLSTCTQFSGKSEVVDVGNLEGRIWVDHTKLHADEPVHIIFTLTNTGRLATELPEVLSSKSESIMDIRVYLNEDELASWSARQPPGQIPHHLELAPGQSKTIEISWVPDERAVLSGVWILGSVTLNEQGQGTVAKVHLTGEFETGY